MGYFKNKNSTLTVLNSWFPFIGAFVHAYKHVNFGLPFGKSFNY
jgi:hypothetical protein